MFWTGVSQDFQMLLSTLYFWMDKQLWNWLCFSPVNSYWNTDLVNLVAVKFMEITFFIFFLTASLILCYVAFLWERRKGSLLWIQYTVLVQFVLN